MNTWPKGYRHAIHQNEHESWNAKNYPGTRQICFVCYEPTERCEEDAFWSEEGNPLCRECFKKENKLKDEFNPA